MLTPYPWWELYYNPGLNQDYAFFKGLNGFYDVGGLYYQNQFDATIDAALVAAEKLGYKNINIEGSVAYSTASDTCMQFSRVLYAMYGRTV